MVFNCALLVVGVESERLISAKLSRSLLFSGLRLSVRSYFVVSVFVLKLFQFEDEI